jgi:hypothetical protein
LENTGFLFQFLTRETLKSTIIRVIGVKATKTEQQEKEQEKGTLPFFHPSGAL